MALVSISDDFNRADEQLNKVGGSWVGTTTSGPSIVSNQLVAGTTNNNWVIRTETYDGEQTSQLTLKTLGTGTTKAGVLAAVDDVSTAPGSYLNIYATTFPSFYRFRATSTNFQLDKKDAGGTGNTTLGTYAATPVANDVIKIVYTPSTARVRCYVNGTLRIDYTDPSPLPTTQTRIGLYISSAQIADAWTGSWDVAASGWAFSEWQGGTAPTGTEVSLSAKAWTGGTAPTGSEGLLNLAATAEAVDTSGLPLVQPLWSEALHDGFGVNVPYQFSTTSTDTYYYVDTYTPKVIELNPGWVRARSLKSGDGAYSKAFGEYAKLAAAGIGIHVSMSQGTAVGWSNTSQADITNYWAAISSHSSYRWSVGGPNEPDDVPQITNWLSLLVAHQKMIWDTRATAGMTSVPISSPSLKDGQTVVGADYTSAAGTTLYQYCDYGDYHRYPLAKNSNDDEWDVAQPLAGGRTPAFLMDERIGWVQNAYRVANNEIYSTEGGYSTELDVVDGAVHVSDDVQAYYAERHLLELVGWRGIKRYFWFEFLNSPDPNKNLYEAHKGLILTPQLDPTTWVDKPSFGRLKTLMATVTDIGGGYNPDTNPYVPPRINFSATCTDAQFRWVLTAKRSGELRVFYWLDKALWNTSTGKAITVSPVSATLKTAYNTYAVQADGQVRSVVIV